MDANEIVVHREQRDGMGVVQPCAIVSKGAERDGAEPHLNNKEIKVRRP
jgi:hypothetical protein